MAFDTRAYARYLKRAGIKRRRAKAHAEAINRYLRPDLATQSDIAALEQRIDRRLEWLEYRLEAPGRHTQLQVLGVMAATLGILLALRKMTEDNR
jgi:hypothetical protein